MAYEAVILDLDGVLTRTAEQHARAWKETFDAFLARRSAREGEDLAPFEIETDYRRFVDGKPRLDGVRSFLGSRGIELPEGDVQGRPEEDSVRGIGARKNERFLALLEEESIRTYDDAVEQLRRWRHAGIRTGLITSSRNGRRILAAAGLAKIFEVVIDGADAARLGIAGKPAPDIFLRAADELGVEPGKAVVLEDAVAGIEAGKAGGFGWVVGVARNGGDDLSGAGADLVVHDVRAVPDAIADLRDTPGLEPSSAWSAIDRITDGLDARHLVLFFDYDGTLTPIVSRPEDARLSDEMRALLRALARRVIVAIVSGRNLDDVRSMVALDELYYAGSHGFDVAGPGGLRMQHEAAEERLPELDAAEAELQERLEAIAGAWVERKRFALAVHFREADEPDHERVATAVDDTLARRTGLRKRGGKKIFELQPDVPWDKGRAVRWLLAELELEEDHVRPVYVGDDVTDEDAFAALPDRGVGIRVGSPDEPTHASLHLRDTDELLRFGRELLRRLPPESRAHG